MRDNKVIQLSEIEHVLQRPGMYIGDITVSEHNKHIVCENGAFKKSRIKFCPGLLKLFDEIISNSIDEALRTGYKFANKINVTINGNSITVADNGRGIPIVIDKTTNKTQAELAFTALRAGGNFNNSNNFISIGTHGLGSTLVNIMSTVFRAKVDDGKKAFSLVSTNNMENTTLKISKTNHQMGTIVEFTPDFRRFSNELRAFDDIHCKLIHKRLSDLAACFPKITFKLNSKTIKLQSFKKYASLYSSNCIIHETQDFQLAVFPVEEPTAISFVNGIETYEGGTHVTYANNKLIGPLIEFFNKKHKKLNIRPCDIRNHMGILLISNKIKNPKFRSQTKEYITNPASEFVQLFSELGNDAFIRKVLNNDSIIYSIIETKKLKCDAAERVALRKANKQQKRIKVATHLPANSKNIPDKILFITEGASAIGALCEVRNPAIHGGMPLRGKPLNVFGKSYSEIIKNEELKNLMAVIGLQLGCPADNLNYGRIGILADADPDGQNIIALLLNFFSIWPDLFNGRITIIKSPILIATKGNKTKRFYSSSEYDASKYTGWSVKYFKGLGGLPTSEYDLMINNPLIDVVELDDAWKASLSLAFSNDTQLRKEWLAK